MHLQDQRKLLIVCSDVDIDSLNSFHASNDSPIVFQDEESVHWRKIVQNVNYCRYDIYFSLLQLC